ncbi:MULTISPECIES: hypothetical protein [Streptomyces]|uniref:Uncharacterized protein n=2 Tax=Streptomyces TaxID=1883 RepID=A0A939JP49_9ACTN|nr:MULTISPECIES: hypothetical protein [Streptomyces]MBO0651855.1 hypothetical protein [Streptomyces triculaminicus]QSY47220.1 hypothetical protein J3S04_17770 [Streptomyces griseocarneus]
MPTPVPHATLDPFDEAEAALATLREALFGARIALPALGLHTAPGMSETVFVDLGMVRPHAARDLARVIEAGTGAGR